MFEDFIEFMQESGVAENLDLSVIDENFVREILDGASDTCDSVMAVTSADAAELFNNNTFAPPAEVSELTNSITRVANDMKMPVPEVCVAHGCLGAHASNNPHDIYDDQIVADPDFVSAVNSAFNDVRAYDLVSAHEMMHGKIAAMGLRDGLQPYAEELLCDVNAGLYAGEHGVSAGVYEHFLSKAPADAEHPAGAIRWDFFAKARDIGAQYSGNNTNLVVSTCRKMAIDKLCNEIMAKFNNAA